MLALYPHLIVDWRETAAQREKSCAKSNKIPHALMAQYQGARRQHTACLLNDENLARESIFHG